MKKIIITTLLLVFAASIYAQEKNDLKGKWLISGAVGYTKSKNESGGKKTDFLIMPSAGYFIKNDVAIGISLGYEHHKSDNLFYTQNNEDELVPQRYSTTSEFYGVLPYLRKYWFPHSELMPFAQTDVRFGHYKFDDDAVFVYGFNIRPGLTYRFNNSIAMDATIGSLGYNHYDDNSNTYGISLSLDDIKVGVVIFF
ncbi:outer membrane beta-barrel protein [Zhouia sp. PK063]|uniref:outer membrane beta-barrel protein n=1 Tax=Zhouia sp. PK063 TaxID=3373602 RepID=UPI003795A6C0